jgi:hypothetical protein
VCITAQFTAPQAKRLACLLDVDTEEPYDLAYRRQRIAKCQATSRQWQRLVISVASLTSSAASSDLYS